MTTTPDTTYFGFCVLRVTAPLIIPIKLCSATFVLGVRFFMCCGASWFCEVEGTLTF